MRGKVHIESFVSFPRFAAVNHLTWPEVKTKLKLLFPGIVVLTGPFSPVLLCLLLHLEHVLWQLVRGRRQSLYIFVASMLIVCTHFKWQKGNRLATTAKLHKFFKMHNWNFEYIYVYIIINMNYPFTIETINQWGPAIKLIFRFWTWLQTRINLVTIQFE